MMLVRLLTRSLRILATATIIVPGFLMVAVPTSPAAAQSCRCFTAAEIVKKCGTTKDWAGEAPNRMRLRRTDMPFYIVFKKKAKNRPRGWWYPWNSVETGTLVNCSRWRFLYYQHSGDHNCMSQKGLEYGSHKDYWGNWRHNWYGWKNWHSSSQPLTSGQARACRNAIASALKTLKSVNSRFTQRQRMGIQPMVPRTKRRAWEWMD